MHSVVEKRRFWRAAFNAPAYLADSSGKTPVSVIDLSLHGALIEVPAPWPGQVGDHCELKVDLSKEAYIRLKGTVTHLEQGHLGLRCDEIDLDSIVHLRRLVELNAGDPRLLERELRHLLRG